jgi:hypothetical protein
LAVQAYPTWPQPTATHAPFEQEPLQQSLGCEQPPPRLRHVPAPASGWNTPESSKGPPDEMPPDEPPLAPLEEASPPLPEEVPPELAPLLDVVPSVDPSSPAVASPPPDEEAPLDVPSADDEPSSDAVASLAHSVPVHVVAPVLGPLPHPATPTAAARQATLAKTDQWYLTLIAAPWDSRDLRHESAGA